MSEPRGPVYLTLPREVLAAEATHSRRDTVRPMGVAIRKPARRPSKKRAHDCQGAVSPDVTSSMAAIPPRSRNSPNSPTILAPGWCRPRRVDYNMASDHPMNLGTMRRLDRQSRRRHVLECVVPWIPKTGGRPRRQIITISSDPLLARYRSRDRNPTAGRGRSVRGFARFCVMSPASMPGAKNGASASPPPGGCGCARGIQGAPQGSHREGQGPESDFISRISPLHQPGEGRERDHS